MPRGRPRKQEVPYDPEAVKEFIKRLFEIEREIKVLQQDKTFLNDEFKDKINQKLLNKVIKLVKIKVKLEQEKASSDTIEEIENMVKDKINMVC